MVQSKSTCEGKTPPWPPFHQKTHPLEKGLLLRIQALPSSPEKKEVEKPLFPTLFHLTKGRGGDLSTQPASQLPSPFFPTFIHFCRGGQFPATAPLPPISPPPGRCFRNPSLDRSEVQQFPELNFWRLRFRFFSLF